MLAKGTLVTSRRTDMVDVLKLPKGNNLLVGGGKGEGSYLLDKPSRQQRIVSKEDCPNLHDDVLVTSNQEEDDRQNFRRPINRIKIRWTRVIYLLLMGVS